MLGIPRKIKVFKISGFFRRAVEKKFHRFDDVFKSGSEFKVQATDLRKVFLGASGLRNWIFPYYALILVVLPLDLRFTFFSPAIKILKSGLSKNTASVLGASISYSP